MIPLKPELQNSVISFYDAHTSPRQKACEKGADVRDDCAPWTLRLLKQVLARNLAFRGFIKSAYRTAVSRESEQRAHNGQPRFEEAVVRPDEWKAVS
jgi:hypothetical protein